jgi:hypothetical protein
MRLGENDWVGGGLGNKKFFEVCKICRFFILGMKIGGTLSWKESLSIN